MPKSMGLLQSFEKLTAFRASAELSQGAGADRPPCASRAGGWTPWTMRRHRRYALDDLDVWSRIGQLRSRRRARGGGRGPRHGYSGPLRWTILSAGFIGVPEIAAHELTLAPSWAARCSITEACWSGGLVDADTAAGLRRGIDEALDAYDAYQAAGTGCAGQRRLRTAADPHVRAAGGHSVLDARERRRLGGGVAPPVPDPSGPLPFTRGCWAAVGGLLGRTTPTLGRQDRLPPRRAGWPRPVPPGRCLHGGRHPHNECMDRAVRLRRGCRRGWRSSAVAYPTWSRPGRPAPSSTGRVARTEAGAGRPRAPPSCSPRFNAGDAPDLRSAHAPCHRGEARHDQAALRPWSPGSSPPPPTPPIRFPIVV